MDHPASTIAVYDEDDWTDIGDLFSDDSDFYGNANAKAELKQRVASYNPKDYWDVSQWDIQRQAASAARRLSQGTKRKRRDVSSKQSELTSGSEREKRASLEDSTSTKQSRKPYNPYEGDHSAKQLSESLEDFLSRLVPSKTELATAGPWIWVANPFSSYRPTDVHIGSFKQDGSKALSEYLAQKGKIEKENPRKAPAGITRMLGPARDALEARIVELAKKHGVTTGKWMLFPSAENVDATWSVVARAVVADELGCSAKVATDDGDPNGKRRLICIYTMDFSDVEDVKRVLDKLRGLGLVKDTNDKSQAIYYKCDAYTHLDIANGNEYRLKASMYSSRDMPSEKST